MKRIKTNNFWKGRQGFNIEAIVLHITQGSLRSVKNHFGNDNSYVSSHEVLDIRNLDTYRCVYPQDTAWHAGRVINPKWPGLKYKKLVGGSIDIDIEGENRGEQGKIFQEVENKRSGSVKKEEIINPNLYTYGIEIVSFGDWPGWQEWIFVAERVKTLCEEHNVSIDKVGLVNHNEIRADKWCPGKYFNRAWMKTLIDFVI